MRLPRALRTVLAALSGALFFIVGAEAGAPQVKTQAPGCCRMMPGDFEITALSDGILDLQPAQLLASTTPGLPFPGIGRQRAEGKGYVWVPFTYNPVR